MRKIRQRVAVFERNLTIAPGSDKASLAAKSALMIGDVASADKALHDHDGGHYEDGQSAQFSRSTASGNTPMRRSKSRPSRKARTARRKSAPAKLMHDAASFTRSCLALPLPLNHSMEAPHLSGAILIRSWQFLNQWKEQPASETVAQLASALVQIRSHRHDRFPKAPKK
jgi:hypothetical protein